MREILFRGKTETGEWLFGFYHNETSIESPASDRKVTRHHIYTQDFDKFVNPETIGQFTGLTDKNGKKIFEGDILEDILCGDKERYVVVFDEYLRYMITNRKSNYLLSRNNKDMEVIGNKWDNPEL